MREYHYPDFMPKEGECVLVRDYLNQEWSTGTFCGFFKEYSPYCWRVCIENNTTAWKICAPSSPVRYTKEDLPIPGQPILVSDDAKEWYPRLYAFHNARAEFPWRAGDRNWKYAAHYDEQFYLAQQKKEVPMDASKQAEKLAEALARKCARGCGCPNIAEGSCPLPVNDCRIVTKKDWLDWAAKQED